jgi:hypothetical protein
VRQEALVLQKLVKKVHSEPLVNESGRGRTGFFRWRPRYNVQREKIMELKYNEIIGAIVKPDDTVATQAEILEWAAENPMPIEEPKKQNTALLEEVIETFKKRG